MWNRAENQIELYLIRHGMTPGNVEHRYIGRQTDEPLSEDGRQQLEKRKDQWAQVCGTWDMPYVFVSPMLRCRQTAEILFPQIPQIEIDPWREMDFGEFEGKNYAQLNGDPRYQAWIDSGGTMTFPGGENPEEFRKRCVRGFEKVIKECRHDQIKSVAVVAHGGTIMSIMDRYARDENGQPDGSYYDYQVKNGEGYELIIADVSSGDGRICAGSDIWRSGVAVSSGENDRSFDLRGGKNYKKLIP